MPILYDSEKNIFSLHTKNTTYQMQVDQHGVLLHLYYGRKITGTAEVLLTYSDRGFSGNPYDAGEDRTYSLDVLPQEFPVSGTGDFRSPALIAEDINGAESFDFRFVDYEVIEGKYSLNKLPAVYASGEEAQTLKVFMRDNVSGLEAELLYGVLPECDIITRSVRICNRGSSRIVLKKLLSANLDFLPGSYELMTFYGRHGMERNVQRLPVGHAAYKIGSRRGMSSHQYNPMMILAEQGTTETAGVCYAMQLVYSGGFTGLVEMDQFCQTRMQLGLMDEKFSYPLDAGDDFTAPEVILSCSGDGLEVLSHHLHTCIRRHVCRGKFRDIVRPILVNSWEAFYFDFDNQKLLKLAEQAKDLGMDMLVLDDGWFGKRDDDTSGLGDWVVNEKKLGGTLEDLVKKTHELGLKFGIWLEPEMVNEDSDLYREHPDWALAVPDRKPVRGRSQLVLDFSRKEVVDEIYSRICKILDQGGIDYVKWDYNRSIADVYSQKTQPQGKVLYDYMTGLYDLLERLIERYPDILIEGCSGGGGRFDAGMLYYTPQIWCSDNTDAADRILIQYGTSFGYPASAVGAHVSAVPNEQTGRITSLKTRSVVAMSGTYGFELDLGKLSEEEKEEIREQIKIRNRYAGLIQHGLYYRLTDPYQDTVAAWEFVSEDKKELLFHAVVLKNHFNAEINYIRFRGLESGAYYQDTETGNVYPADVMMEAGLPLPVKMGEYISYQWHFTEYSYV